MKKRSFGKISFLSWATLYLAVYLIIPQSLAADVNPSGVVASQAGQNIAIQAIGGHAAIPGRQEPGSIGSWTPDPFVTAQIAGDPQLVQRKLEAAMYKLLNHPKTLTVNLQIKSVDDAIYGRFEKVTIKTERGEIDHLILDKADIEFNQVHLDTTKLILEEKIIPLYVSIINMDIIIKEDDLNSFLREKSGKLKVENPKVEMNPGKIVVSGSTRYGFVKVSFWATGDFGVQDSKAIWFYTRKMKVNGLGMPRPFVGSVVKRINPILNLEKFPFRLNLKEIKIEKGALHFTSSGGK